MGGNGRGVVGGEGGVKQNEHYKTEAHNVVPD